jgi:hypothetical protein
MSKEQLSQLVQDVIDGKESIAVASGIIYDLSMHLKKCSDKLFELMTSQNGNSKDIHQ